MDFEALQQDLNGGADGMAGVTKSASSLHDTFQFLEELGHGAYGTVVKAKSRKSRGQLFAIKHIDKKRAGSKGLREVFGEVETMSLLNHPNIVRLEEVYQDDSNLWIVMEYVAGGELQRAMKRQGKFPEAHARRIAMNLLFAVDYIHHKGIVHRDLKPANCLLNEEGELSVKIADFGFSIMVGSDQCLTSFCGTTAFMAPEIIMDLNYGKAVDMWAIGVIIYYLLSGEYPFVSSPTIEMTDAICQCKYTIEGSPWNTISPSAKELIARLLVVDPQKRLTARDALKHPWVRAAMTNELQPLSGSKTDGSNAPRVRTPKVLFRGGVFAVMAAHRLLFIMKCVALKRENTAGSDLNILKNFPYLVGRRYNPPHNQLIASGMFIGNHKAVLRLVSMVEVSSTIEVFDVSSNSIDSLEVMQQIVRVATNHPSLVTLNLDNNPIPPLAGRALLRLARSGGKIKSINVNNTLIGSDMIQQIASSLKEAEKKRADAIPHLSPIQPMHTPVGGSRSYGGGSANVRPSVSAGFTHQRSSAGHSRYGARTSSSSQSTRSTLPPLPSAALGRRRL